MQIKIFNIPIGADESMTEELNHFLRAHKIIDIKKDLAMLGENTCWTFCITYMQDGRSLDNNRASGGKVDYKDVLDAEIFERFSNLRKLRKQIADNEAIPAYAVFTDAELAEIAKLSPLTLAGMQKIPGIGKKKMEKYGNVLVENIQTIADEENGISERESGQP
ncbi:MAG: HRDC domain-containing protein [Bacteroidales bacterium]|nr:HRDC domain-containing protein [Bacteroidales bacterium]